MSKSEIELKLPKLFFDNFTKTKEILIENGIIEDDKKQREMHAKSIIDAMINTQNFLFGQLKENEENIKDHGKSIKTEIEDRMTEEVQTLFANLNVQSEFVVRQIKNL